MTTKKEIRLFFLWKQEKYVDNKYFSFNRLSKIF